MGRLTSRTLAGVAQVNPAGEKAMNVRRREAEFQQYLEGVNVAFDFGGVLVPSRRRHHHLTHPLQLPLPLHPLSRALFNSIKQLRRTIRRIGAKRVFFIKRVETPEEEAYFHLWMHQKDVFVRTGLLPSNILISSTRAEKAMLCLQHLIHIMVDDRYEVFDGFYQLGDKAAHIKLVAFKPDPEERARYPHLHGRVTDVDTWEKIYQVIAAESLKRRRLRIQLK